LIGGLALLCFAKVFGLSFLGQPRAANPVAPREAPASMLAGMALLLAVCLWIGLAPATVLPLLAKGLAAWPLATAAPSLSLSTLAPAGAISLAALLLILLLAGVAVLSCRRQPAATESTWGCGYLFGNSRMQYSVSSFSQIIGELFHWARLTRIHGENPHGLFPGLTRKSTHTPDAVLDLLVLPACRQSARFADRTRHLLHHGILNLYVLYTVMALCLLLWLALT
jgi:hydrogenase-4 component B